MSGSALLALAFLGLIVDRPFNVGSLTIYSSELLLAGLALAAWLRLGWRGLWQATPAGIVWISLAWCAWLGAHAFYPGPAWGGLKGALRAGELLIGLCLPLWLGVTSRSLAAALGAAAFCAAWGLAQSLSGPGSWLNLGREAEAAGAFQAAAAGMGHHNQFGAYLAAALPAALAVAASKRLRKGALAAALLCVGGIVASSSRGAWLGVLLGALAAAVALPRRWAVSIAVGLALAVAVLALGPSDYLRERFRTIGSDGDRHQLLQVAMRLWDGKLAWGQGPGSVDKGLAELTLAPGRPDAERSFHAHLHNTYLQWAVEFGLAAALLPLALMAWLAWSAWQRRRLHPAWSAAALAMLAAFALQAGTDVLTLHARGAAISLWWGLALVEQSGPGTDA